MRITSKEIHTEENQGKITLETAGTTRLTIGGDGSIQVAGSTFTDSNAVTIRGFAGGAASISAASAATASGTSGLTGFTIAHGLASTPTIFAVEPANTKAALANLLGAYRTADATNVYFNTITSVTAASAYSFNWLAAI